MATTKAITGNTQKNDGGKIVGGGDNTSTRWGVITLRETIDATRFTGTSEDASHVEKAVSGGTFSNQVAGNYISRFINSSIAGVANSTFRIPASDYNRTPYSNYISYNRNDITSWNRLTGAPTYGANRGVAVKLNDTAGNALANGEPFPTRAVPGELVYRTGSPNPTMSDYQPITN